MGLSMIMRYSLSALLAGAAVVGCFLATCLARGQMPLQRRQWLWLLLAAYFGALLQITALRIGLVQPNWLHGDLKPIPFQTSLEEAAIGAWMFVYNVFGNILWFVPLGWLLAALFPGMQAWRCLLVGAALSLLIECTQFLLGTGVSDFDDLLFNSLGTVCGWGIRRLSPAGRTSRR